MKTSEQECLKECGVDLNEINYHIRKYKENESVIAVAGEFNAGKSCFINCLIGRREFLPTANTECTPILIDLSEGDEDRIVLKYRDGSEEIKEHSSEVVQQFAKFSGEQVNGLLAMSIPVTGMNISANAHIIDTPGTNTVQKEHEDIADYIVKKADLVIYVFSKVIAQTDVERINHILNYTSNILFVMSQIDTKDGKDGEELPEDEITKLIEEAHEQIREKTQCLDENIVILPIGSIKGLTDTSRVDTIKEYLKEYVTTRTAEQRKKNAAASICTVINERIEQLNIEKKLFEKALKSERNDIKGKINALIRKKDSVNSEQRQSVDFLISKTKDVCSEAEKMLSRELKNIEECTKNELLQQGCDNVKLCEKADERIEGAGKNVCTYISKSLNVLQKGEDRLLSEELQDLLSEFDIDFDALDLSGFKQSDKSDSYSGVEYINKQLDDVRQELEKSNVREQQRQIQKEELAAQLNEKQAEYDVKQDEAAQLGVYRPRYDTKIISGGMSTGQSIGKFIGEVGDLALLIWNPAGGALEAADKVKDASTIFRYLKNTISVAECARRKVRDGLEDRLMTERDTNRADTISQVLDMLSLGFWAEKLGGKIGEMIKPTQTIQEENEQVKEEYYSKKKEIDNSISSLSDEILSIKLDLDRTNIFPEERRLKRELEEKEKLLIEAKNNAAMMEETYRNAENQRAEQEYYFELLETYISAQLEKGKLIIERICKSAGDMFVEYFKMRYDDKLADIAACIEKLEHSDYEASDRIAECDKAIGQLENSKACVENWLQ